MHTFTSGSIAFESKRSATYRPKFDSNWFEGSPFNGLQPPFPLFYLMDTLCLDFSF